MKMNIVMPMAGLGSRFRDAGYVQPKPLIDIKGRPMYAWATDSLPLEFANELIFILLESQKEFPDIKQDILQRYKKFNPIVLSVPKLTRGQSETVLTAKKNINNSIPLLIHNADTGFKISNKWLSDLEITRPEGALLVFKSYEKRWSFLREDESGNVVEVREKEPISEWASTGTYYFGKGSDFVRLAEKRIENQQIEAKEYYIAPLYNDLIALNGKVKNYRIDQLLCFGTPEDMKFALEQLNKISL